MYSHGCDLFDEYKNASLRFNVFNLIGLPDQRNLTPPVPLLGSVTSP